MHKTIMLTVGEETKPVRQWARELGMDADLLYRRIRNGWSDIDVLNKRSSLDAIAPSYTNHRLFDVRQKKWLIVS